MALKPVIRLTCCHLPSVYNNKQSYYECLCYLEYKINECISAINDFTDDYKNYTDTQITNLRSYIDTQLSDIQSYIDSQITEQKNYTDNEIARVELDYNNKIDAVSSALTELTATVFRLNTEIYAYINQSIERLMDYIEKYACLNIRCYNPTSGSYDNICKILNDIYDASRMCGITCNQFDSLELTCDTFEAYEFSAHEFDLYAGCKLYKNELFYMHSPFTGQLVFYQDVIYQLAGLHMENPITAEEFDAVDGLTCETFAAYDMTAYQFDNNAKSLLI